MTFTTVGYGDKFPVTAVGQYINTFAMFLGVFVSRPRAMLMCVELFCIQVASAAR